jgi:hypothetical protein
MRMIKKVALSSVLVGSLVAGAAYLFQKEIGLAIMAAKMAPEQDFAPALMPAQPDYTEEDSWAALPGRANAANDRPEGENPGVDNSQVSVFFVHPTSYFNKENWNQPLTDESANWVIDQRVLRYQASVFNGCCQVYAPRYRQANFYSFFDASGNGAQALDAAYRDVAMAFDNFITRNAGRPFILAGHSQGSHHGARLLRERIVGTPLQAKLVAAYLVGFTIDPSQVGGLPVCESATATGCVIGWNSAEAGRAGMNGASRPLICVNPLSWGNDEVYVEHALNPGSISFPASSEDPPTMQVQAGVADARCSGGNLAISKINSDAYPSRSSEGSMHIYDYNLFYISVRDNALQRVAAYLSAES